MDLNVKYKTIKLMETREENLSGLRTKRRSPRQHQKHNLSISPSVKGKIDKFDFIKIKNWQIPVKRIKGQTTYKRKYFQIVYLTST